MDFKRCWENDILDRKRDADRLDIRRVGIVPEEQFFYTDEARDMVSNQDYSPIDN